MRYNGESGEVPCPFCDRGITISRSYERPDRASLRHYATSGSDSFYHFDCTEAELNSCIDGNIRPSGVPERVYEELHAQAQARIARRIGEGYPKTQF